MTNTTDCWMIENTRGKLPLVEPVLENMIILGNCQYYEPQLVEVVLETILH
jgi:hypothetical protein